jgi:succinate dehydrogenase/fumarate reductase cytochrome b subunit
MPVASPRLYALSRHTLRQLKFIIPGATITFLLNTHRILFGLLSTPNASPGNWSRIVALIASCLGGLVVLLFLYVLLVHWFRGVEPNYRSWRQSGVLSRVIPTLTAAIVAGWSLLSITLGKWSSLGYLKGTIGASGLYALVFGLIGLVPAPIRRS